MATTSYLKNAPLKDKIPGSWDLDVCHEGEADLYKHHKSCQKHPDHKGFIPVDKFDIEHLPADYQDRYIVEYIKLVAQLTVRLTVRYVSPDRPATIPGTDTPYPLYENRGEHITRVGTGLITKVLHSGLAITTAAHVVFNNIESEHTSCHLFYDNGDQPGVCNTAIELVSDGCYFFDVTSNTITDESVILLQQNSNDRLLQKIDSVIVKHFKLRRIIKNRLLTCSYDLQNTPLTFIVSHPHGCSKTISIGRCVEIDDNLDDVRFLYTTPTCPGSSGAAVICLDKQALNLNSTHSGTWKDGACLNIGSGRYIPTMYPISDDGRNGIIHHHEYDRRLEDSWRLLTFRSPPEFDYNLMYDYINMWTYLYFYVYVKYVSEQRPEFWPASKLPYPCYKKRGSRKLRFGRGWVDRVDIYPNQSSPDKTCDCDTCRYSSTPERKFAHIYILTSTSLVFDAAEAAATSNFITERLNMLSGTQPVCSNVETDRSQLVFVTHDLVLAETLTSFIEHVSFLKDKIQDKLFPHLLANPISIKLSRYGNITVGRCVRVGKDLVYTNEAVQKDVGAPVIVLGHKDLHVDVSGHTGKYSLDPKYGYSRHLDYQYKSTHLKDLLPDYENFG